MGAFNTFRLLRQARKNQWLKPKELEELQAKRLRAIIKHAYENTEFYHRKFSDVGIKPEDICTVNDLHKIPFTTKDELRKYGLGPILARGVDLSKCTIEQSSGSTGVPIQVAYDSSASDFSKAINLRSHVENGLRFRSKWAIFSDPRHVHEKKLFQKLGIFSPDYISATDAIEKSLPYFKKINPDVIDGYSSCIKMLAEAVEKYDIREIEPKVIFGTSELLTPDTRQYINTVFDLEMLDQFGCLELNRTAWECNEHSGYHIDVDAIVMEIVKGDETVSSGELGEVTYTGLYNYAMPLIRYKVGDLAIKSDELCPCGRGLPLLEKVEGRTGDLMYGPNGRVFSPMIWYNLMRRIPGIEQYKIIQEKRDLIRVLLVKDTKFSEETLVKTEHDIKEDMGENVNVQIELVDEISRDASGKLRFIISKVNEND